MIVFVDIGETICAPPEDRDCAKAEPIKKSIKKLKEHMCNLMKT